MTRFGWSLTIAVVCWIGFWACDRQGPPPKPIGAATNKHVEQSSTSPSAATADAMIQRMKTPMDEARETEDLLTGAADNTARRAEEGTP